MGAWRVSQLDCSSTPGADEMVLVIRINLAGDGTGCFVTANGTADAVSHACGCVSGTLVHPAWPSMVPRLQEISVHHQLSSLRSYVPPHYWLSCSLSIRSLTRLAK